MCTENVKIDNLVNVVYTHVDEHNYKLVGAPMYKHSLCC